MKSVTTIARTPNNHPKLVVTQVSSRPPVVEIVAGAMIAQTMTARTAAPAIANTRVFVPNERPVRSTPIPGMRAGWMRLLVGRVTSRMTRRTGP